MFIVGQVQIIELLLEWLEFTVEHSFLFLEILDDLIDTTLVATFFLCHHVLTRFLRLSFEGRFSLTFVWYWRPLRTLTTFFWWNSERVHLVVTTFRWLQSRSQFFLRSLSFILYRVYFEVGVVLQSLDDLIDTRLLCKWAELSADLAITWICADSKHQLRLKHWHFAIKLSINLLLLVL